MGFEKIQRYLVENEKFTAKFTRVLQVNQQIVTSKYWTQNIFNHLQPAQGKAIS